jgi:hypothetical protein
MYLRFTPLWFENAKLKVFRMKARSTTTKQL